VIVSYTYRNGSIIAAHITGFDGVKNRTYGCSLPTRVSIKRKQQRARQALAALFA
jgi:hypothetical protein